jgi:hypothetical protein
MLHFLPEPWVMAALGASLFVAAGLIVWLLRAFQLAIYVALAGAAMLLCSAVAHEYEARGSAEVQVKWDADKAERIRRTTELTLELSGKLMAAMDAAKKAEATKDATFSALQQRATGVASGPGVQLDNELARLLIESASAANSARPDSGTKAGADPVPDSAATAGGIYDERELAVYFVGSTAAYADAYGLWKTCRDREDGYLAAMAKGAVQ